MSHFGENQFPEFYQQGIMESFARGGGVLPPAGGGGYMLLGNATAP